jgi:hypothetical protein
MLIAIGVAFVYLAMRVIARREYVSSSNRAASRDSSQRT